MTEKELKEIFGEDLVIYNLDAGPLVLCDLCNKNYTNDDATGGFLFTGHAVCPDCEQDFLENVKRNNEEHFIRAFANDGETFRDFVYRIRKERG